jgi:hypothetical protein
VANVAEAHPGIADVDTSRIDTQGALTLLRAGEMERLAEATPHLSLKEIEDLTTLVAYEGYKLPVEKVSRLVELIRERERRGHKVDPCAAEPRLCALATYVKAGSADQIAPAVDPDRVADIHTRLVK